MFVGESECHVGSPGLELKRHFPIGVDCVSQQWSARMPCTQGERGDPISAPQLLARAPRRGTP